jgi:hypothetical protein
VRALRILVLFPILLSGALGQSEKAAPEKTQSQRVPNKAAEPDRHLGPIAWMVGGTWATDVKPPNGPATRVENRLRYAPNNYFGVYAWAPARKVISFWYTSAEGELTIGTVIPDPDRKTLHLEFTVNGPDGNPQELRSTIAADSDDSYLFTAFNKSKGAWVQLFQTRYDRQK